MSRDVNKIFIIGRLVRDPEIKYTPSGTPVTKFSIANNQSFKQGDEIKEYVNFFDVNVWGNQAVSCEKYLRKGKQVAITGSLRQNRWEDKDSGQNRSRIEITADSVQFLGSVNENTNNENNHSDGTPSHSQSNNINDPWADQGNMSPKDQDNAPDFDDSDIPF